METETTRALHTPYTRFVKPLFDRLLGLVLGLLTLPLVLVLLAMSWAAFGWPPLQRVARVGRNGNRFNLYRINARRDHHTDLRGRHRRLSAWLRRTSLDELPQLWNVALGHMSLVGPRPLDPVAVQDLDGLGVRNAVRPGLTGPWQVEARGDGRLITANLHLDRRYVETLSFKQDLSLLFRTLPSLVRHREEV